MPVLNSDGLSIIQDFPNSHPIAIVGNYLVVNAGGNSEHMFTCGCEFIFEECILRIVNGQHEQQIAYSQSAPRAALKAIAEAFILQCSAPTIPPPPAPVTLVSVGCDAGQFKVDVKDEPATPTFFKGQESPLVICKDAKVPTEQNHAFFKAGSTISLADLSAHSTLKNVHQVMVTMASIDSVFELTRSTGNANLGLNSIIPIIIKYLDPNNAADYGVTHSEWHGQKYNDNTLEIASDFKLNVVTGVASVSWTTF